MKKLKEIVEVLSQIVALKTAQDGGPGSGIKGHTTVEENNSSNKFQKNKPMKLKDNLVGAAKRGIEIGASNFMLGRKDANPEHEAGRAGYYKTSEQKAFQTGYRAAHKPEWQEEYKEGKKDLFHRAIEEGHFDYPDYEPRNLR